MPASHGLTLANPRQLKPASDKAKRLVLAGGKPIPLGYGRFQAPAYLYAIKYVEGVWTAGFLWCVGECQSVEDIYLDGIRAGLLPVTVESFTGTLTQGVSTLMRAADSGYGDRLVHNFGGNVGARGMCHSVIQWNEDDWQFVPNVIGLIRGLKVGGNFGGPTYTTNPVWCQHDMLTAWSGEVADMATAEAAADYADEMLPLDNPSERRRTFGLRMEGRRSLVDWMTVMDAHSGSKVYREGGIWKWAVDGPKTNHVAVSGRGDYISLSSSMASPRSVPTRVEVVYTDTSQLVWEDDVAVVDTGHSPPRTSRVSMPGVTRYSQALREAHERVAKLSHRLRWDMVQGPEGLLRSVGDPFTVEGRSAVLVEPPRKRADGTVLLQLSEHDNADYDDSSHARLRGDRIRSAGVGVKTLNYGVADGGHVLVYDHYARQSEYLTGFRDGAYTFSEALPAGAALPGATGMVDLAELSVDRVRTSARVLVISDFDAFGLWEALKDSGYSDIQALRGHKMMWLVGPRLWVRWTIGRNARIARLTNTGKTMYAISLVGATVEYDDSGASQLYNRLQTQIIFESALNAVDLSWDGGFPSLVEISAGLPFKQDLPSAQGGLNVTHTLTGIPTHVEAFSPLNYDAGFNNSASGRSFEGRFPNLGDDVAQNAKSRGFVMQYRASDPIVDPLSASIPVDLQAGDMPVDLVYDTTSYSGSTSISVDVSLEWPNIVDADGYLVVLVGNLYSFHQPNTAAINSGTPFSQTLRGVTRLVRLGRSIPSNGQSFVGDNIYRDAGWETYIGDFLTDAEVYGQRVLPDRNESGMRMYETQFNMSLTNSGTVPANSEPRSAFGFNVVVQAVKDIGGSQYVSLYRSEFLQRFIFGSLRTNIGGSGIVYFDNGDGDYTLRSVYTG